MNQISYSDWMFFTQYIISVVSTKNLLPQNRCATPRNNRNFSNIEL